MTDEAIANLPVLKHKIAVSEREGKIVLDITDETAGLGLLLYFEPHIASRFGWAVIEHARFSASKESGAKEREAVQEFLIEKDIKI